MTLHSQPCFTRALWAIALCVGGAAAHAASGYSVSHAQQSLVTPGMTTDEVRAALGRPSKNIHYRNEPGPTFTYEVTDAQDTLFDVDFDANGKVLSTSERIEMRGGDGPVPSMSR